MNKKPIIILAILIGMVLIFGLILVYSSQTDSEYYETKDTSKYYEYDSQNKYVNKMNYPTNNSKIVYRYYERDIYEDQCGNNCFRYPEVEQRRLEPCPGRNRICESYDYYGRLKTIKC